MRQLYSNACVIWRDVRHLCVCHSVACFVSSGPASISAQHSSTVAFVTVTVAAASGLVQRRGGTYLWRLSFLVSCRGVRGRTAGLGGGAAAPRRRARALLLPALAPVYLHYNAARGGAWLAPRISFTLRYRSASCLLAAAYGRAFAGVWRRDCARYTIAPCSVPGAASVPNNAAACAGFAHSLPVYGRLILCLSLPRAASHRYRWYPLLYLPHSHRAFGKRRTHGGSSSLKGAVST